MKKSGLTALGIIIGGRSVEHEISVISGLQAYFAVDKRKYNVKIFYLTKNNNLILTKNNEELKNYQDNKIKDKTNVVVYRLKNDVYYQKRFPFSKKHKLDCMFPIVHGKGVEDGSLSGYLNMLGIPYPSAGILPSAIAQDKIITKHILKKLAIPTIRYQEIRDKTDKEISKIEKNLAYPLIIKPATLGSSIGIKVANNVSELKEALIDALKYDDKVLVEEKKEKFTEYNCAIYKIGNKLNLSQIEEVRTASPYLTFTDKYEDGGLKNTSKQSRIIPAHLNKIVENQIYEYTKKIYTYLNFKGVIRIDYIYDLNLKKIYVNEINTIPGSLAFYLYEKKNLSYTNLLDDLIKASLIDKAKENEYISSFDTNILKIKKLKMKK